MIGTIFAAILSGILIMGGGMLAGAAATERNHRDAVFGATLVIVGEILYTFGVIMV